MPKMKTHRGAAKRLRLTASGKIRRNRQNRRHILTKKEKDRKRSLRKAAYVSDADHRRMLRIIGA